MIRGSQRSVFLLGLLALAATAHAQTQEDYQFLDHWVLNNSQDPFPYYLDARNNQPAGNDLTLVEDAVKKAFQAWQDVDCAWPAFSYKGKSTIVPIPDVNDRLDGFSVAAIWVTDPNSTEFKDVLNAGDSVAAAVPLRHSGYVYQCDIFLNAVSYKFTTLSPTPAGFIDIQTAVTREVGHCLGLGSTFFYTDAVMYFSLDPGQQRRTLTSYDKGALCKHYPQTGAVGSPCDTTACGAGLTCVTTRSTTSGATQKICSKACPTGTPGFCPAPYQCIASTLVPGAQSACLPEPFGTGTKVGNPCADATTCGAPDSRCLTDADKTTAFPAWTKGYCTESCIANADCPTGSTCATVGSVGKRCLKDCRPGKGDCREGYTCTTLPENGGDVCVADCATSSDCGGNYACRSCDHACVAQKTGTRNVGDPCLQDSECGTNQQCLKLNGNPQGVCAEPCSVSTCTCSPGNTCRPAGTGDDRFCFRDCGAGTCSSPLQCVPFAEGTACIAPCRTNQDCPNGLFCGNGGKCEDPYAQTDGGTCALCGDGGTPPPPPVDGGTGGSTNDPGGCGCQSAPTSAAFLVGLGVLLLATRRRRNG
ncbi:adhesin [Corallococcus exercitus]|uniref:MYXO-CTERM sorting domain-containing protein n=1 Tax=Corallococcus exercitus TaxID=2316736 RepID=UPI000EA27715|nr:MYXO-CTERM sorting domain-containing protein [Corallococcus exercitus]RKG76012.1 adhesin [Corallococcus exercitus]